MFRLHACTQTTNKSPHFPNAVSFTLIYRSKYLDSFGHPIKTLLCTSVRARDTYIKIIQGTEYEGVKKRRGRPEWAYLCINYLRRPTREFGLAPFRLQWAYLCLNYLRRPTRALGLPPFRLEWAYLCINYLRRPTRALVLPPFGLEWAYLCINFLRRPTRALGLPPFGLEWAYLCINYLRRPTSALGLPPFRLEWALLSSVGTLTVNLGIRGICQAANLGLDKTISCDFNTNSGIPGVGGWNRFCPVLICQPTTCVYLFAEVCFSNSNRCFAC